MKKVDNLQIALEREKSEEECARAYDQYIINNDLDRELNFK